MRHAEGDRVVRRYERFAMVPVQLLRSPSVSSHAVRVFLLLDSYANWTTQEAFPAQSRLAEDMGVSLATVKRAIAEVVSAGYLEVLPRTDARGMRVGAIYTIFDTPRDPGGEPARDRADEGSSPAAGPPRGDDTHDVSGQLTGELSGGVTAVVSGQLTGELSDSSPVSCQNEILKINKTDNDKLRNTRAGAREGEAVVSSAAPAGRAADTGGEAPEGPAAVRGLAPTSEAANAAGATASPAAGGGADHRPHGPVHRNGETEHDADPQLQADLLAGVPGLDAGTAQRWIRTYGSSMVRERLEWLKAEMAAKLIPSPVGWMQTSLVKAWPRPPQSYRHVQAQIERTRRRVEAEAAAAQERAARDAEIAEGAMRLQAAAAWFTALPQAERSCLDHEIRSVLAQSLVAQANGIPQLPEVLTAGDLAAKLWRDRLVSAYLANTLPGNAPLGSAASTTVGAGPSAARGLHAGDHAAGGGSIPRESVRHVPCARQPNSAPQEVLST